MQCNAFEAQPGDRKIIADHSPESLGVGGRRQLAFAVASVKTLKMRNTHSQIALYDDVVDGAENEFDLGCI